jgi:hypothetical protein
LKKGPGTWEAQAIARDRGMIDALPRPNSRFGIEVVILMKSSRLQDLVGQESDPTDVIDADSGDAPDEFPVFEQGDLPLHFVYGLFDRHCFSI